MVIVGTSIWIDHLRKSSALLGRLLEDGEVAVHPFVVGELACGNLRNRTEFLVLLQALPSAPRAEDAEILFFVERHGLHGKGLGLIDIHLLASSRMCGFPLWTRDLRLHAAAADLGISYIPQRVAGTGPGS